MNEYFEFLLKDFETSRFPEELCTVKNKKEKGVFESKEEFICIVDDERFDDQIRVMILCPYIYKEKHKVYYGWYSNAWDSTFFSSKNNPIHTVDDEYVIAWRKLQ